MLTCSLSAAQAAGTLSLVVLHAAPLVQLASGSGGPRLEPVAHSKRSGLRAWQGLLHELRGVGVAARVRLDVATLDTLQHALTQLDRPLLHFLPARGYQMNGLTLEDATGELRPLSAPRLRELLSRHPARLQPSP